jgi:serine kinase of HPr protein (carbohydrate metabolism regulator)
VSDADAWTSLHATAVVVGEQGLVLRGPSGAGKSALALALIARGRESGSFAALIGDDRVFLRACAGRLLARGAPGFEGLIERRFEGVIAVRSERCAVARLVVDLVGPGRPAPRLPEDEDRIVDLLGVLLPRVTLDPTHGPLDHAYAALQSLARLR